VPLPLNSKTLLYPWQQLAISRIKPLLPNLKYTTDRYRGNATETELLRFRYNELFANMLWRKHSLNAGISTDK
jgi:hypothetical protein